MSCIRFTFRRLLQALVIATILVAYPVSSQELLLHGTFDGTPSDIYVRADHVGPTTIAGRHGNTMQFKGPATVARPFDFDHAIYPQMTVTAWVGRRLARQDSLPYFRSAVGRVSALELAAADSQPGQGPERCFIQVGEGSRRRVGIRCYSRRHSEWLDQIASE
jgi:hypothetical protein